MNTMDSARKHVEALLKLPADERSEAAEALLESLEDDADDGDIERAWASEIENRVAHDEHGIPAADALAEGRARLKSRP